jgi:RNA polymerase sigma-70 factor, ECF subfamily
MNERERHALFSELIGRHQSELYAYIFAIVRNWEDADDLFQSVCVVLWQKFESFRSDSSFFAWARQTAKFKVRQFMARKQLPSHVNDELLEELAETIIEVQSNSGERDLAALERCREKLDAADEELLDLQYVKDLGSRQIADQLQRSQASVCHSLKRIRRWLFECIQAELAREEYSARGRA